MGAIFCCLNHLEAAHRPGPLARAFVFLPAALVLDVADGMVARGSHRSSPFGADLDSLADVISFGVAPAVLAFTLGMRGLWDALVLCAFVCCGVGRLARFNETAALADASGKVRYYEGTPIPTSLGLLAVLALAWWQGAVGDALWLGRLQVGPGTFHPLVLLYAASGAAMVSRVRIPKL